jgi:uncharacterized protein (DUF1800 family)
MNRRNFLKVMGAGAGATAFAASPLSNGVIDALAAAQAAAPAVDPIWHAVNRLTYGPTPGLVSAVKQMGLPAFIEQQLAPEKIDDSASEALLGNLATLAMTIPELAAQAENKGGGGNVELELIEATTLRAIYSQQQLLQVMTNFWSEHFNIWSRKDAVTRTLTTAHDRDVIRKFALGKFRDLLGATATSPAMLDYLDNDRSDKVHPNENYGRELLELHTLGVNGGYSENDVQAAARAFTGWTLQPLRTRAGGAGVKKGTPTPTPSPTPVATTVPDSTAWEFTFNAKLHDTTAKTFMTLAIPAGGGMDEGQKILDYIAVHPSTALHIATKLCIRFIGDTPSDSAIKAVQQSFLQSGGDIKAVLRTLFALPDFTNAGPKYKRPWEYVLSLARVLNVKIDPTKITTVLAVLQSLGHVPFDHDMANGYPDVAQDWEGNMLTRWNIPFQVLYGNAPGVKIDLNAIVQSQNVPIEINAVMAFFAQHFYGRALTPAETTAFNAYLNQGGMPDLITKAGQQKINDVLGLMLAGPAFQYR